MAIEAGRKDKLKSIEFELELSQPGAVDPALTERHNPSNTLIILLILIITLPGLACQVSGAVPTGTPPVPSPTAVGEPTTDWITLYFTQPEAPSSETLRGGPDRELASAIRSARASVEVAAQQLDLWSIRDALIDAHRRGVSVRVVVESDYMDEREIQEMVAAGIPLLGDRREGLMHNKFAVIDRQEVWTGSANFTINGIYRNNNNLVRVRSPELAGNYLAEFEEMFVDDRFGPGSPANTPNPRIEHDGVRIETLYSPDDGVAGRLVELVSERAGERALHGLFLHLRRPAGGADRAPPGRRETWRACSRNTSTRPTPAPSSIT